MRGLRSHLMLAMFGLACLGTPACAPQLDPGVDAGRSLEPSRIASAGNVVRTGPDLELAELDRGQIAAGRAIAVRDCSSCHALDANTTSPNAEALPLQQALWRFDEDALASHLIDAISVGHGAMPLFDFNVIGADALIAYLRSIRSPRGEPFE